MAYGLIYNLNFSSDIAGNRRHRISIYKDGHTATITTADNNIIGTEEPAVLVWDNTDDIYNNIMSSRLEINLYSDNIKQVDIEDILDNTTPAKFKVEFYMENHLGQMALYWFGFLSNATYEQRISSVPVKYQLIATDLLATLKNIYTTDGTAIIDSQKTVIKYIENVLAFLPYNLEFYVSNDIQLKPFKLFQTFQFQKLHLLQWLFPFSNGLDLFANTADQYIVNALKVFNSKLFFANNKWYIINNSSYKDVPEIDRFDTSGEYLNTFISSSVVLTIPTDLKPINNDLSIRYDTPIDTVEVIAKRNQYTTDFDGIGLSEGEIRNLTPYPSFETKINGILFNQTYYSDDFSVIQRDPFVKKGNYSIKTQNYISSGNPSVKIMDTGLVGDFQWDAAISPEFFCSYFIQGSGSETEDFHLYYSLVREVSATSTGLNPVKYYWNGNNWIQFTLDSSIAILQDNNQTAPTDQWVQFSAPIPMTGTSQYARFRIILWQPKINGAPAGNLVVYFDEVLIARSNVIEFDTTVQTISKIQGSSRKNKKLTYEFQHFYPVTFGTEAKSDDITFTGIIGSTQLNRLIAQQILNDNRKHVKRYSISCYITDFSKFIFPYNKININLTGYQSNETCMIDRITYRAKSGVYNLEFHETNQDTNVTLATSVIGGSF